MKVCGEEGSAFDVSQEKLSSDVDCVMRCEDEEGRGEIEDMKFFQSLSYSAACHI